MPAVLALEWETKKVREEMENETRKMKKFQPGEGAETKGEMEGALL